MTVQDLQGVVFDSIVFGERNPKRWMAGSNNFRRTRDFNGSEEQEAVEGPVHIAMVYSEDGTIRGYRNGQPYGKAYESNGPVSFESGKSQILFGNRHGTPGGNRLLRGRIHEARLYRRALTDEEVAASARANGDFVSEQEQLAAMQPAERELYKRLRSDLGQLESRLKDMEEREGLSSKWADLAHALFNLKEFIYIR
jgi:hypothetical protein